MSVPGVVWSEWRAALAWGDLLTEWHLTRSRDEDEPNVWQEEGHWDDRMPRLVATLLGYAVVHQARTASLTVEHPHDLVDIPLAAVVATAEGRSIAALLVTATLRAGPRQDEVGADEVDELQNLVRRRTSPEWKSVTQLGQTVGRWHLSQEDWREDATLGDRLARRRQQIANDVLEPFYGHLF